MKINLLLTSLLLTAAAYVFGQQIQIVSVSDLTTDLSGTTVEVEGDKDDQAIYFEFRVINESSQQIEVKYERIREFNSGRIDAICDNFLCVNAADAFSWTSPTPNPIVAGSPGIFKPQITPGGMESCAVHNYYVVNDAGVIYDSVRVIFKTSKADCNLSVDSESNNNTFNIYPNPAQEYVILKGDALKNGGTVLFLDALGKEVKRSIVKTSGNPISVSDLQRGVYFVNIYGQDGAKSTIQRLIIR